MWYSWTAPADGVAIFDTAGSTFDTILAVYTGKTVANLQLVAENDNDPLLTTELTSRVLFPVKAETVYRIAVVGQDDGFTDFALNWTFAAGASIVRFASPHYWEGEEKGRRRSLWNEWAA